MLPLDPESSNERPWKCMYSATFPNAKYVIARMSYENTGPCFDVFVGVSVVASSYEDPYSRTTRGTSLHNVPPAGDSSYDRTHYQDQ